jgi:hypothetical protein
VLTCPTADDGGSIRHASETARDKVLCFGIRLIPPHLENPQDPEFQLKSPRIKKLFNRKMLRRESSRKLGAGRKRPTFALADQWVSAIKVPVYEEPNHIINDGEKHGWVDDADPRRIRINGSAGTDQCLA